MIGVVMVLAGGELPRHLSGLEAWVEGSGLWGIVGFVCIYVVATSVLVPDTLLGFVTGVCFGLQRGLLVIVIASAVAATLQFVLARRLVRSRIGKVLEMRPRFLAIQRAVLRDGVRLQTLLRLTPLNRAALSYVLAAAGVGFPRFLLACLGMIPGLFLEVYLGVAAKHVGQTPNRLPGAWNAHDLSVIGGAAVSLVVVIVFAREAVEEAVTTLDQGASTRTI